MLNTLTRAGRPPRPQIPPLELRKKAHPFTTDSEIDTMWTTPDGDVHLMNPGGVEFVIVDPATPDGAGQSGFLLVRHPKGYTFGHVPNFVARQQDQGEGWTVEDLAWCAGKVDEPSAATALDDGWNGWSQYLLGGGEDQVPIRAYRLLRFQIDWRDKRGGQVAVNSSRLVPALRRLIADSGWLAPGEAKKL